MCKSWATKLTVVDLVVAYSQWVVVVVVVVAVVVVSPDHFRCLMSFKAQT